MNLRRRSLQRLIAPALLACCTFAVPHAMAQSSDAKPADTGAPASAADANADTDREAMRARLERQLQFMKDREQKLQDALDKLDKGAPLDDVRDAAAMDWGNVTDRVRDRPGDRGQRGDRPRRGPGDGRRNGPPGADRPPLGPDDMPRIMDFIERHNPELAKDLHDLADKDPQAFHDKLAEIAPRIEQMISRFEDRPERFQAMLKFREIDRRAHDLARQIASDETNAAELTAKLRDAVAEGFDLRVQLGQTEIQDLQNRIGELQKRMQHANEDKDAMVDARVKDLIQWGKTGEEPPPPDDGMGGFPPGRGPRRGPPGDRPGDASN